MDLTKLADSELLTGIKAFRSNERKMTAMVISHLEEIERRKLYCNLKYKSLYEYCMHELGYSNDQAYRRINAMKVVKRTPKIMEKLEAGDINLTTINLFSNASKELELRTEEQNHFLSAMENKSKKACEEEVQKLRDQKGKTKPIKKAHTKRDKSGKVRMSVSLDANVVDALKQLALEKGLSLEDAIAELVKKESAPKEKNRASAKSSKTKKSRAVKTEGKGRYIPKKVKELVNNRASGSCEHCQSKFNLQYDHIKPYALGGKSEFGNIRLLCGNCNLRAGIKVFGVRQMQR